MNETELIIITPESQEDKLDKLYQKIVVDPDFENKIDRHLFKKSKIRKIK